MQSCRHVHQAVLVHRLDHSSESLKIAADHYPEVRVFATVVWPFTTHRPTEIVSALMGALGSPRRAHPPARGARSST